MSDLSEINAFSGFLEASPAEVVSQLKELGLTVVTSCDYSVSEARITTVEFEGPKGMGIDYAAIGKNLIACTCPETLRRLKIKLSEDRISPGTFSWSQGLCHTSCQWLVNPPENTVIRGAILRSREGDSILLFDADTEEFRAAQLSTLKAFVKASRDHKTGYFLATVVFCGLGDSVEQIMVDFDGFITARKGNTKQGSNWILAAMKQYVSIWSNGEIGAIIAVNPRLKSDTPKWMIDIFTERRWDKKR